MLTQLKTSDIKNAMYGSTQLSAVYKGHRLIWQGVGGTPNSLQLVDTYYKKAPSSGGCTRGNRYDLHFHGAHTIEDPGREFTCQYFNSYSMQWLPADYDIYWVLDTFTTPGVGFDFRCTWIYNCGSSGTPPRVQGRMRYRLSDGTELDWAYSPPALFDADEEYQEVFIEDPPNGSETGNG